MSCYVVLADKENQLP